MLEDESHLELGSQLFRFLCTELNSLLPDEDPVFSLDGMSGGFKFSDEAPQHLRESETRVLLPCIALLRRLWAYRVSAVLGSPRPDLAPWWEAAKELAPNWPGFLSERCSDAMLAIAEECDATTGQLSDDLEQLDKDIRRDEGAGGLTLS